MTTFLDQVKTMGANKLPLPRLTKSSPASPQACLLTTFAVRCAVTSLAVRTPVYVHMRIAFGFTFAQASTIPK